jgi:hypothetical protein
METRWVVARLRIDVDEGVGWKVDLDDFRGRRAVGTLSFDKVTDLVAGVHAATQRRGLLVGPVARAQSEQGQIRAGRYLARVFGASSEVAARLGALRERAGQRGVLHLVVDAPAPEVASLPWELIAPGEDDVPFEFTGEGVIARQAVPGPHPPGPWLPGGMQVVALDEDPIVASRSSRLREMVSQASVVFLVCHGTRVDDLLLVGQATASGWSSVLEPVLAEGAPLVLEVCHGGMSVDDPVSSMASWLVRAGARGCVAPAASLAPEAAEAFASGFLHALGGEASLAMAAAAGRAAVRGLPRADLEADASRLRLWVGYVEGAVGVAPSAAKVVPGIPLVLADAAAIARDLRSGFVGVEHLALALLDSRPDGVLLRWTRSRLISAGPAVSQALGGWNSDRPLQLSPRLQRWLDLLERPVTTDLWDALLRDDGHVLHELCGGTLRAPDAPATATATSPEPPPRGPGIMVASGPWDGQDLELSDGAWLGRPAREAGPDVPLQPPDCVDGRLSRRHLRWLGDRQLEVHRRIKVTRGGQVVDLSSGTWSGEAGDLVALSASTWLRIL